MAIGIAIANTSTAVELDFTGSNIYVKFLDGDRYSEASGSIDTISGGDNGQFTELELRMKAIVSKQVEAGARVQSRSSAAYWNEFGFDGEDNPAVPLNHKKFMKLRGAYIDLLPEYDWLNYVRIGSSDWGMFDPFTFGKMRYIDRDNINGLYFKGPMAAGTWELARISTATFLGPSWRIFNDASTKVIGTDNALVFQFKHPIGDKIDTTLIYENTTDTEKDTTDTTSYNGQDSYQRYSNSITGLKFDTRPADWLDLRLAYYHSTFDFTQTGADSAGGPVPSDNVSDNAFRINMDFTDTGISGLSFNFEYFDIGAGFTSVTAARRESDVLLSEGSESAWFRHGDALWVGGLANEMQQVVVNGWLAQNEFMDFDETGAESVVGWKGFTLITNLDMSDIPITLELTSIDYNNNWQDFGGNANIYNGYGPTAQNQDRETTIAVLNVKHIFDTAGGLDTSFKYKIVNDEDTAQVGTTADDRETDDNGATVSVGNQLTNDVYGSVSYGMYSRDVTLGGTEYNNDKDIFSIHFNYNLPGFEAGMLTQWISGEGDPNQDGTVDSLKQYRLKAYAKVLF